MDARRLVFWLAGAAWLGIAWVVIPVGISGPPLLLVIGVLAVVVAFLLAVLESRITVRIAGIMALVWMPLGGGIELLPAVILSLVAGFWRVGPAGIAGHTGR